MENSNYFLEKPEVFNFYTPSNEKEIYINTLGYHNFHFVKGAPNPRNQSIHTLHFVISGKGHLIVGGKKYEISRHDIFYLDDKTAFAYYPDKNQPWEYVFFVFGGEFAEKYTEAAGFSEDNPVMPCQNPQRVTVMLYNALTANPKEVSSYFSVLSAFYGLLDSAALKKEETGFFYESNFIEAVKNFIEIKYLSPDFDIPYICHSMGISHSHLCRIFRQKEKISVVSYIGDLKMKRAEKLLQNPGLSLKEIAVMCGYRDYEYFLRCFTKKHKKTPTEYRLSYDGHGPKKTE